MADKSTTTGTLPLVVIAHQSAIPHYRVPFYSRLVDISRGKWDFGVVFDTEQQRRNTDFSETVSPKSFRFRTLPVSTRVLRIGSKRLLWQEIGHYTRQASLLITDTHLSNLAYPATALLRPRSCKWALWGHTHNRNLSDDQRGILGRCSELIKRRYVTGADAFFAYTEGEKDRALEIGINPDKITVLHNTIDVATQRAIAIRQQSQREELRHQMGFRRGDVVFVMVGRLLPGRRVDFLLKAFKHMCSAGVQNARLVIIGSGNPAAYQEGQDQSAVTYTGAISDPVILGKYLTAADVYIIPGMIGLAPLQALAHELPVIGFELETHGPEVEYLTNKNATLLDEATTVEEFAQYLKVVAANPGKRWSEERYASIAHLTIENMAMRFDQAVCSTLGLL